jgi:hypothetical protein
VWRVAVVAPAGWNGSSQRIVMKCKVAALALVLVSPRR